MKQKFFPIFFIKNLNIILQQILDFSMVLLEVEKIEINDQLKGLIYIMIMMFKSFKNIYITHVYKTSLFGKKQLDKKT